MYCFLCIMNERVFFLQGKYAVKMQRNFTRKILTHCNIRAFDLDFAYLFVIWEVKSEINDAL